MVIVGRGGGGGGGGDKECTCIGKSKDLEYT